MGEVVDGQYQKYTVESAEYVRNHFFGTDPALKAMADGLTDTEIKRMRRGGHDPAKVHAAYHRAMETKDRPTVILAKTVKGYGLGAAGEGQNITHSQKKMGEEALREFRTVLVCRSLMKRLTVFLFIVLQRTHQKCSI